MNHARPTNWKLPLLHLKLNMQFAMFSAVILVLGMLGIGSWVTSEIEQVVTAQAGSVTALYVDAIIAPVTQTLRNGEGFSDGAREHLDRIFDGRALAHEISAFKLWNAGNEVIYSTRPQLVGQVSQDNPRLIDAQDGNVHAELRSGPSWSTMEGEDGGPQIEVYIPIFSEGTGQVLGVAEFYTHGDALMSNLIASRIKGWAVVGLTFLAMFGVLYVFFARANRTIEAQRAELHLANQNIALINEKSLRRLSFELHDGPVQLLSFAALRLDAVTGLDAIKRAIDEALEEIRLICRGLVLPELGSWSLADIAGRLTTTHEERHGTPVAISLDGIVPEQTIEDKNCVYRFIQETLNNSARHSAGGTQAVSIVGDGAGLTVTVSDSGVGFDADAPHNGLGLAGLRERITGLAGTFHVQTAIGEGTRVSLWLPGRVSRTR